MKPFFIILIAGVLLLAAAFTFKFDSGKKENIFASLVSEEKKMHDAGHAGAKEEIDQYFQAHHNSEKKEPYVSLGMTSHHLPNALPLIFNFYQNIKNSSGPRKTFVILAPDHLEKCPGEASTTRNGYITPYGKLEIDEALASEFLDVGIPDGKSCFEGDHSVGAQAIMIKKLFPEARILPVVLSSGASRVTKEKILNILSKKMDRIFVLGSVDFSHHHPYSQAESIDGKTQKILESQESGQLTLENIDSPAAGEIIIQLARKNNWQTRIIDRKNSYIFSGKDQDTTGYMSVIFIPE